MCLRTQLSAPVPAWVARLQKHPAKRQRTVAPERASQRSVQKAAAGYVDWRSVGRQKDLGIKRHTHTYMNAHAKISLLKCVRSHAFCKGLSLRISNLKGCLTIGTGHITQPDGVSFLCSCRYTSPDFLYVRSWLPCIFFSGGVTVGNIGRQLAMVRPETTTSSPPCASSANSEFMYLKCNLQGENKGVLNSFVKIKMTFYKEAMSNSPKHILSFFSLPRVRFLVYI